MDSDSDCTIDSDELEEFISQSQKSEERGSTKFNSLKGTAKKVKLSRSLKNSVLSPPKKVKASQNSCVLQNADPKDDMVFTEQRSTNVSSNILPKCEYGKSCFRKNPDHLKYFNHGNSSYEIEGAEIEQTKKNYYPGQIKKTIPISTSERPKCPYGNKCYRKNPIHIKEYDHDDDDKFQTSVQERSSPSKPSPVNSPLTSSKCQNYQFFLTKVSGIHERYNKLALDIKDILSFKDGTLISSAQFNYMFDIPWLMQQYPEKYRSLPLTIVHGEQRESKKKLERSGADFPNINFCQAKLDIPFGTHHTKMMFLLYKEGFRVVIHTSNIVDSDWLQRTQGMWVSPVLPELHNASASEGESKTNFKADLLDYVSSYSAQNLDEWCQIIKRHDFSKVKVVLVGSVPGRHVGSKKTSFGHLKLRKILNLHGASKETVPPNWPIIGQFSSIGSLGASPNQWLTGEFISSLSTTKALNLAPQSSCLKLVFPTEENVRKSLQGYPAGASLPYSIKVAQKQPYLKEYLHQWKSDKLGRSEASPHIKTYLRVSPDNSSIAWFLLTSANLSKAAWGALEKKGTQFMIRSYELGVLFLPKFFEVELFSTPSSVKQDLSKIFPVPYDIPLEPYAKNDVPWIWDIPHVRAPDRFGQMWCPP